MRDCFSGREAAKVMSTMAMIMMLAPLVAPAVGSLLLHVAGWWLIFVFLAVYAAFYCGCWEHDCLRLVICRYPPHHRAKSYATMLACLSIVKAWAIFAQWQPLSLACLRL
ncbi:hypothetical protein HSBAA_41250 [Vreelandella sulfidaeris]|uniref:Major facilitator superfamily (MFS) profile domain-containing protein n=1 Tax=Vreelandella sulfidaeris TaxID=115553 RepID=A0A455UEX5_9GAMM|nr:hypothetical protein HSBAA_41250 [Halomonas sulfidaeris]